MGLATISLQHDNWQLWLLSIDPMQSPLTLLVWSWKWRSQIAIMWSKDDVNIVIASQCPNAQSYNRGDVVTTTTIRNDCKSSHSAPSFLNNSWMNGHWRRITCTIFMQPSTIMQLTYIFHVYIETRERFHFGIQCILQIC